MGFRQAEARRGYPGADTKNTNGRGQIHGGDALTAPTDADVKKLGLIKLLADALTTDNHFARDAGGKLYRYADGVYKTRGEVYVKQEVKRLVEEWGRTSLWSSRKSEEVAEYILVDAPELWPSPPVEEVNLLNGILDVHTRTLRDHDPGFLSTVRIPVSYDPEAECPEWDKFIAATFPEDAARLAYEIPADLMLPERSMQKAILLIGEGSNGKSTYLDNVARFVGATSIAGLSLQKLESDRFSASRLVGKLANICPDLPSTHLTETSTFKALTGGDTINAEYKYRESFEFKPFCRLVFSANHVPRSQDASHAFFRRWVVVPFDRTFEGGVEISRHVLDAKLSDAGELSGLLNKALAALPGLRERGFTESASMREAWEEFRAMTDPVSVWLDRHTVEDSAAFVSKTDLRDAYNRDCDRQGRAGMSAKALTNAIKRVKPALVEGQRSVNGKTVWCWLGIGLVSGETDPTGQGPGTRYSQDSRHSRHPSNCLSSSESASNEQRNNNKRNPVNPVNPVNDGDKASRARQALEHGNGARKVLTEFRDGTAELDRLAASVAVYWGRPVGEGPEWKRATLVALSALEEVNSVNSGGGEA